MFDLSRRVAFIRTSNNNEHLYAANVSCDYFSRERRLIWSDVRTGLGPQEKRNPGRIFPYASPNVESKVETLSTIDFIHEISSYNMNIVQFSYDNLKSLPLICLSSSGPNLFLNICVNHLLSLIVLSFIVTGSR